MGITHRDFNEKYCYHIIYKTVNIVNGKQYIGLHSTNNLQDNYLGSGKTLIKAIKKYGKINFIRSILSTHKTREEAEKEERKLVSRDFLNIRTNYNIVPGGKAMGGLEIWNGPHAERLKKLFSEAFSGYKNPDFVRRWMGIYESIAPMCCYYICSTNLPDEFIRKIILARAGISIKIHRVIKYYEYKGYIKVSGKKKWKDYFSKYPSGIEVVSKTIATPIIECIPKKYIEYKSLRGEYIDDMQECLSLLKDMSISDSMIYNGYPITPTFKKEAGTRTRYYEYLGILKEKNKLRINVRKRLPKSQRATGLKTTYETIKKKIIFIETKGGYNEYNANFNGRTIQKTRIPDPEYGNWKGY